MNEKSPFESYLSGRAAEIDLPAAGPGTIADRVRARRRRRRAGSAAVLGAAVLLGGAVLGQGLRSSDDQQVESYGAAVGAAELDWTMVDVSNGLGWTRDIVRSESGALYALSTASGDGSWQASYQPVVYTSVDGAEWSPVAMAEDLRPNGLAASGGTVYAVGTGAGGGVVRLASSDAPDSGWTVTDLPLDLEAESVGLPGRLYVAEVDVASSRGTTVVAATVTLQVDSEALMAGEDNPSEWYPERDGMVRWVCEAGGGSAASTTTPSATSMPGVELTEQQQAELHAFLEREAVEAGESWSDDDPALIGACGEMARQVKSWPELGVDPAVGELVAGEVRLFSSAPEGSGDPEEPLSFDHATTVAGGWGVEVLAGDDGFWVLSPAPYNEEQPHDATEALYSPDGLAWSTSPSILDGNRVASGVFDGSLHAVTVSWQGGAVSGSLQLHRLGSGSTSSLDLSEVAGLGDERYFAAAEVGPLGVVIVTSGPDGGQQVLHSADGTTYGRSQVPAAPVGQKQSINGVTMSADAVKVRLNLYPADDISGGPPEAQRLFVGTPR